MEATLGSLASLGPKVYNDSMTVHPVGRTADAVSKLLTRTWKLPPRRTRVTIDAKIAVPMKDGTQLLADHYIPVTGREAPTVLVRCPYGRSFPFSLLMAQLVAERGYHVLLQSCRGTYGSGGDFEPMRNEITDGQDTVSWLREQSWFNGRLATYGASYLGFVQWALAMDPPPELEAMVVQVGPHDFSRSAYHNGAFDLFNFLSWSEMMAQQERNNGVRGFLHNATAERRLRPVLDGMPIMTSARTYLGAGAPWFESWLEHPDISDEFWSPLRCGPALDRISVPTLLVGGWQDLFIEQTLDQYAALTAREVPARLLVGPWAHLDATRAGVVFAESLDWLDRHIGGQERGEPAKESSVRVFVGGSGQWRDLPAWPPPGSRQQSWYLAGDMTLTTSDAGPGEAGFRYDPAGPTPSVGGAIMSPRAGVRDNRPVEGRPDVLVYTSAALTEPVEIIGEVTAAIELTRDNPHCDLFLRLCDVDPRGVSRNVCDGIVRLTDATALSATVAVSLVGAAHRFEPGHRLRLQVAGGAHPRFLRNPGTGGVDAPPKDLVATSYRVGPGSVLLLPLSSPAA
jgi:putative CocE/NonD family hydrolase